MVTCVCWTLFYLVHASLSNERTLLQSKSAGNDEKSGEEIIITCKIKANGDECSEEESRKVKTMEANKDEGSEVELRMLKRDQRRRISRRRKI